MIQPPYNRRTQCFFSAKWHGSLCLSRCWLSPVGLLVSEDGGDDDDADNGDDDDDDDDDDLTR